MVALALLVVTLARGAPPQQPVLPLYGLFETSLTNNKHYKNPFADVMLNASFSSPSGRKVRFFGFYDGDGAGGQEGTIWRLRFMPDEPGDWTYDASFSDGQPGQSGEFSADPGMSRPGPLRVDPDNPRWFVHASGDRFYLRGYYYSEAFTAKDDFWKADLDKFFGRGSQWGFNFISTVFWQGELLAENHWNALPYNGFHPVVSGDVTRLDLSAWHHVDEVLRHLDTLNTVWYNFDGFIPNVGGTRPATRAEEEVLLRNWVARIAPYWNITWNIAFEWSEFMSAEDVNRIARFVKSIDPWNHVMTVHNHGIGTEPFGSDDWLDFYSVQYDMGVARSTEQAYDAVHSRGNKPVFAQEVVWEGDGKLDEHEVLRAGWGVITGAGLLNYAEQFRENGSIAYGDGGGLPYVRIMFDITEKLPYWRMSPGCNQVKAGTDSYCLAEKGRNYLVYLPDDGTVRIDPGGDGEVFDVTWVNPRDGSRWPQSAIQGGKVATLNAPDLDIASDNSTDRAGETDRVLLVVTRGQ